MEKEVHSVFIESFGIIENTDIFCQEVVLRTDVNTQKSSGWKLYKLNR